MGTAAHTCAMSAPSVLTNVTIVEKFGVRALHTAIYVIWSSQSRGIARLRTITRA